MTQESSPPASRGSLARQPDLDWSQVRETVLVLKLAAAQIMASMRDSDTSVVALAQTFASMADYIRQFGGLVEALPHTPETAEKKAELGTLTEHVGGMVNQAIVAFQFYDRLVQRLSHVVDGLDGISHLVSDKRRLYDPEEWVALQNSIYDRFSTPEERVLFEAVLLKGLSIEDAMEGYLASLKQSKDSDIEFF